MHRFRSQPGARPGHARRKNARDRPAGSCEDGIRRCEDHGRTPAEEIRRKADRDRGAHRHAGQPGRASNAEAPQSAAIRRIVSTMREAPLLRMTGISKRFGATQALADVALEVYAGQSLALIGENGAGKSTLMKILSGAHAPDAGTMELDGRSYRPANPHAARKSGVAMIYQELNLAPDLSVEDNMMLGQERHRFGWLDRAAQRHRVREVLNLLGHAALRPDTEVRRLSVGARQLVEIGRALILDAKLIVFDEPTSSLTQSDARRLFEVIGRLKKTGYGIVYISHFLEEIRQVCDRYAVLRDGRTAGQGLLADATESQIVSLMVGRSVEE